MNEKSQMKVYVPQELHDIVNADHRSNSEVVKAALWSEYGGRGQAALQQQLEELERRRELVLEERQSRDDELAELDAEMERIEAKIEEAETHDEQIWREAVTGGINEPEVQLKSSRGPWEPSPDRGDVHHYADRLDISPEEFCDKYLEKQEELTDE